MADQFDFGKKKRPSKKPKETAVTKPTEAKQEDTQNPEDKVEVSEKEVQNQGEILDMPDYAYEELVKRIFGFINDSGVEKKSYTMKPPLVYKEGTKKTLWVNFPEIVKLMNRNSDHVISFVLAELGTTGNIDGVGRFVLRGKFQPKHIETVLRRYIAEYVKCHTCKTAETHLKKDNRLTFMVCDKCGSTRSVAPIKTGFQVATRQGRRAARN